MIIKDPSEIAHIRTTDRIPLTGDKQIHMRGLVLYR